MTSPRRHDRRRSDSLGDAEYKAAAGLRAGLRRFLRYSEQITRANGLTPERYELLLAIKAAANDENRGPTVNELAATLDLALSSTTQLVRRAEDSGLLQREVAKHDARVRHLRLTEEGEQRLTATVQQLQAERITLAETTRALTKRA
jgi:DNA-binding MarR family transcriptional regulator